jgi:putative protein-disulfide isomerase
MRQPQNPRVQKNQDKIEEEDRIRITFYTDPLCCWSWAFEAHWQTLLTKFGHLISYSYVMGGMVPTWKTYNDPLSSVSTPVQMGPVWMHASEVTGTKMKHSIWALDPPESSYPPSIAVKTVALQSTAVAEKYFFEIRKAMMEDGVNISNEHNLLEIARQLSDDEFDLDLFVKDWRNGKGKESFREDLKKTKFHGIGRFPTLTFQNPEGHGIMIIGYRPYKILEEAFLYTLDKSELAKIK